MRSKNSRQGASPADGSILSHCPNGKLIPWVFMLDSEEIWGGPGEPKALFITQESQTLESFKVCLLAEKCAFFVVVFHF